MKLLSDEDRDGAESAAEQYKALIDNAEAEGCVRMSTR